MTNKPAISVVIPLYNKECYIASALNSVLNQTFQDFEVIVVDDGPNDAGASVVRSFGDPRIRLLQGDNQGVSAARNRGIEVAGSDLIAFLDADDEWLPSFIETIRRLRASYPDAGLYGTAYEVHFPGTIVKRIYNKYEGERLLSSYFGSLVEFNSVLIYPSTSAVPKEILKSVGGFPLGVKWNEDGTLWGKIALQYPVAYSPKVCSIYNKYTANNSSAIREYLDEPFIQYISTLSKDELLSLSYIDDLMEYCDYCRLAAASRNIFSGYGSRARKELQYVKSPRYIRKKRRMRLLSYIPPRFLSHALNNAKNLSYIKWKLIRFKP